MEKLYGPFMSDITEFVIEQKYKNEIEDFIYTQIEVAHSEGKYSIILDKSYRKYYKLIKQTFKKELCYKVTKESDIYCLGKLIYIGEINIEWNKSIYRRLKLKWKIWMKNLMETK